MIGIEGSKTRFAPRLWTITNLEAVAVIIPVEGHEWPLSCVEALESLSLGLWKNVEEERLGAGEKN